MPLYSIKGPDGKTYSIQGPAGASREQVIQAIQEKQSQPQQPQQPQQPTTWSITRRCSRFYSWIKTICKSIPRYLWCF
jgi:hypothetical protein